jgi:hypothetical protein
LHRTSKVVRRSLAIAVVTLVAASLSFAKSHRINVIYSSKVGTTAQLNPGTYQLDLIQSANSPKLAFYNQEHKRVAQVPIKIKTESRKNPYTEIEYDTVANNEHAITAIRLGGWNEEFVVPSPSKSMASKPTSAGARKSSSSPVATGVDVSEKSGLRAAFFSGQGRAPSGNTGPPPSAIMKAYG